MPSRQKNKQPSFEKALEELENMVETMESGQLPLEQLITNYEHGAQLISHCESVLNDARKRLELLTLKPATTDEPTPSSQQATTATTDQHDDEIRLF